jgi:hypothetical protein
MMQTNRHAHSFIRHGAAPEFETYNLVGDSA